MCKNNKTINGGRGLSVIIKIRFSPPEHYSAPATQSPLCAAKRCRRPASTRCCGCGACSAAADVIRHFALNGFGKKATAAAAVDDDDR